MRKDERNKRDKDNMKKGGSVELKEKVDLKDVITTLNIAFRASLNTLNEELPSIVTNITKIHSSP
jgi:hypothetical protein